MAGTLTRRNFLSFDFGDRSRDPDHWVRIHRIAMACRFEVMLSSDDARDMAAARAALDEADDIESVLTVFREGSVVSHVNRRAAHEDVTIGGDLFNLLTRSAELHAATGGAFDITCSPYNRCWTFLEEEGRLPTDQEIAAAGAIVGMGHVHLDAAERTVRFDRDGVELDFGAIAKGFALDRMAALLRGRGARARCSRPATAACWRSAARAAAGLSTCGRGSRAAASAACGSRTAPSAPPARESISSRSTGSASARCSTRAAAVPRKACSAPA
jgi:hypothetical protein